MSDVVPHKGRPSPPGGRLRYREKPHAITFTPTSQPELELIDGTRHQTTCLGCQDAPCMELTQTDIDSRSPMLTEFPRDPSRQVCPVEAMEWDRAAYGPTIDANKCIGCGLCAARCPYGAISLSPDGVALVHKHDPDAIASADGGRGRPHTPLSRQGALGGPHTQFVSQLPAITARLNDIQRSRLTRNILLACGVGASTRRKGDTNIRIDGVLYFYSGCIGVVELETSTAALDSPRALLEDIAVLHGRFNVPMDHIVPISILTELPNVRTEYYQVIDDISSVLDIRCRTLTLGVLCLLMWRFWTLPELKSSDLFTTKAGTVDLLKSLRILDPDFPSEEPYPGAYWPAK